MATLQDLSARMKRWKQRLPKAASDLNLNVSAAMVESLVLETPVDTSQALSNWTVGINEAPTDFIPPIIPGAHGSTQGASADEAYQAAVSVLGTKQPGDVVYISNNAPYIGDLNDGTSTQAPSGFIEAATDTAFATLGNQNGLKLDG